MAIILHDYWRSGAAYRVRIALAMKSIAYERRPVDLAAGEQRGDAYAAINPARLVPTLEVDGVRISNSVAIIDWLDSVYPDPPLLPREQPARAIALSRALAIVADIHPLQNLRVLNYLTGTLGVDEGARAAWLQHWLGTGLAALERDAPATGFLSGAAPGLADIVLVPQLYSARRFGVPLDGVPRLVAIDAAMTALPAVAAAAPEAVKPA